MRRPCGSPPQRLETDLPRGRWHRALGAPGHREFFLGFNIVSLNQSESELGDLLAPDFVEDIAYRQAL